MYARRGGLLAPARAASSTTGWRSARDLARRRQGGRAGHAGADRVRGRPARRCAAMAEQARLPRRGQRRSAPCAGARAGRRAGSSIGPHVNVYSARRARRSSRRSAPCAGCRRPELPLDGDGAGQPAAGRTPADAQTEVFAFGRMPLAFSARCFTARHYRLNKDQCEFRCHRASRRPARCARSDGEPFLVLNGIQTQSARLHALPASSSAAAAPPPACAGCACRRAAQHFDAVVRAASTRVFNQRRRRRRRAAARTRRRWAAGRLVQRLRCSARGRRWNGVAA
ncbi:MAG: hypothetical protein MZW92_20895 [Comamonadaceae bacterium]|nr:hypothetical protein [Comamonadaceae bacterium]